MEKFSRYVTCFLPKFFNLNILHKSAPFQVQRNALKFQKNAGHRYLHDRNAFPHFWKTLSDLEDLRNNILRIRLVLNMDGFSTPNTRFHYLNFKIHQSSRMLKKCFQGYDLALFSGTARSSRTPAKFVRKCDCCCNSELR